MTTARERYENKTKVVTFRVSQEMAQEIAETKAQTGLSNADLIKLGADIAREEVKAKLDRVTSLESRITELEALLTQEEQTLNNLLTIEREQRLNELDAQMEAFHMFDQGWSVQDVAVKLKISEKTSCRYFDEWGEMRKNKKAIEKELLRRCLLKHIEALKEKRSWSRLLSEYTDEDRREIEEAIDICQRLLSNLDRINQNDKEYLIGEYAGKVLQHSGR